MASKSYFFRYHIFRESFVNRILRSLTSICALNKCNTNTFKLGLQRTNINGAKVRDGNYILLLLLTITFILHVRLEFGTTDMMSDALVNRTGQEDPDVDASREWPYTIRHWTSEKYPRYVATYIGWYVIESTPFLWQGYITRSSGQVFSHGLLKKTSLRRLARKLMELLLTNILEHQKVWVGAILLLLLLTDLRRTPLHPTYS